MAAPPLFVSHARSRRVPWQSWREWSDVCDALFSADSAQQQLGIDRVSAWISRGAVPTAVRATAQCVEWLMQYSAHTAATAAVAASWPCPSSRGAVHLPSSSLVPPPPAAASHTSAQMLRTSGAMCLQRLVNGLVDPLQKRAHAMSVASLARLLQLPPSFVELRHEAAHGPELPTMAVIQSSCKRAVAWLRQQYWRPQRTHHRRNDRDSLRDALISFHAAQRQSAAQHGKASAAHKSKQQHQQHQQPNAADQIGDEAAFSMMSETAKSLALRITSACQCDTALVGVVLFPALLCPSATQLARDAALDRADGDEDDAMKFDDSTVAMPDTFLDAPSDDADEDDDDSSASSSSSSPAFGASSSERRPHFAATGPLACHRNLAPNQLLLPLMPLPSWPKGKTGALPAAPPLDTFHSNRVAVTFASVFAQWRPLLSLVGRALPSFFPRFLHAVIGELRRRTAAATAIAADADIAISDSETSSAADAHEAAEQWGIAMLAAWARSLLIDLANILSTKTAASSANQWTTWFAVASCSDSCLASPVVAFAIQPTHSSSSSPRSSAPTKLMTFRHIFDELAAHARAILGDPSIGTLCIIQPLLQCISALQLFCAQQGVRDATDSLRFDTQLAARLASAATLSFASPSLIAALTASSEATESVLVDTHASCWFEWLRFAADAESSASVDDLVAAAGAQPEQPTYVHPRADDVSTSNAVASSTDSIIPPLHCNRIPQSDTWALVSDWIPCPIGMMPRSLASPASSSTLMMTMPGAPPPTASFPSAHTRRVNMQQQHPHPHSHNVAPDMQQRADAETATKRRRLDSEHIAVELL